MPTGYPGTKAPHGTVTRYVSHACRCDECKQANRAYYGHRPREVVNAEREPQHGTESRYINRGCRCDACRMAQNVARNDRRSRPNVKTHGSNSSYSNGCRCDECRSAHTVYCRELRQRRKASA